MSQPEAEQLALDGLAPPRRRVSRKRPHEQCEQLPIAQVVLDVQASHLGQTFDYLVDSKDDKVAQPGVLVRVRFGNQKVNGIIWSRTEMSQAPQTALKYIERVVTPQRLISDTTRRDISAIAQAFGGTRANIVRLALPPRVARIDREQASVSSEYLPVCDPAWQQAHAPQLAALDAQVEAGYGQSSSLQDALVRQGFASFVLDALPGPDAREQAAAWMIVHSLKAERPAVVVLPDTRHMMSLASKLQELGLHPFAPVGNGEAGWTGDFVVLGSSMPPAERYRSYLALASGQVRCVLGLRAAMYAPVEGPALFAIMDDAAYQYADGMMPYANARAVLRLRAKLHQGCFVTFGHARSARSQWECTPQALEVASGVTGPALALEPAAGAVSKSLPWVRWLNREELARLVDPAIGARVPHTAVSVIAKALQEGPVLLSIPQDGQTQSLSCASCHRQARCPRCTGPLLAAAPGHAPRCSWCGRAAVGWKCPSCSCERMRAIRVGAAGTAQELQMLFRGVPIMISTPFQPRGVVERIDDRPRLVIATLGAEPKIQPSASKAEPQGASNGAYQAVAILDAWTSLYAQGVDARLDMATAWMRVVALCKPRVAGGQALIVGESDPALVQAVMTWHANLLAADELADRSETGLPPSTALASIWGSRQAVDWTVERIGAGLSGDMGTIALADDEIPSLLGPVPIAPESTLSARPLDGTGDRVRALVRVPLGRRDELASRLQSAVSAYVAARGRGELRFCMDPKDLT
ncbi:primosome assembly protein PriA [Bombiscardovia apis]|uniref:Primosome assembly protein PriA n=1 Tax=Bombiscardovia apis TaxID=2932182 RepID=A0ABN6SG30_9BIFI|nr:primosomal protein N' [Bombiscardovia apis]BDR54941.1 primosome assembly protein PriA [Bombiscardovia apis]